MSNGWSSKPVALSPGQVVGASSANTPISLEFPITAGGACIGFVAKVSFSAATITTAITAKLQTAIGATWVDAKTAAVTASGDFYIKVLPTVTGDQAFMPLLNKGRLVLTTGAGDSATVLSVDVLQEL